MTKDELLSIFMDDSPEGIAKSYEIANGFGAKRRNAAKDNKEFSISLMDYAGYRTMTHCEFSGVEFNPLCDATRFSFERIDPKVGYVKGNVAAVAQAVNTLKGNTIDKFIHSDMLSPQEQEKILSKMLYRLRKRNKENEAKQKAE